MDCGPACGRGSSAPLATAISKLTVLTVLVPYHVLLLLLPSAFPALAALAAGTGVAAPTAPKSSRP
jgi:hypothetical protein